MHSTEQSTTGAPDLGCSSDCVILGEHATCQSRISWVEEHQTNEESAPCPAAHVVVMSQCDSCSTCLFRDVVCATKQGVSQSVGEDTFMYRKYSAETADGLRVQNRSRLLSAMAVASAAFVSLLVTLGVSLRHRHWWSREIAVVDMEDSAISVAE